MGRRTERNWGHEAIASSLRLLVLATGPLPRALTLGQSADHPVPVCPILVRCRCMDCSHLPRRGLAPGQQPRSPNSLLRVQKTFSAGPRSLNSKELWVSGGLGASEVQPVSDSRHGRIACKVSLSYVNLKYQENRRLQSTHRALGPTPLLAGGGSLNHLVFLVANSGNIRDAS